MVDPLIPLLTVRQVSDLFQLRPSCIYDAVAKGRLPAVKLWQGRRRSVIRFKRQDILAFIESRRAATGRS